MNRIKCLICNQDTVLRIPTMILRWALTHCNLTGHTHFRAAYIDMPNHNFELKVVELSKSDQLNEKVTKWIKEGDFYFD